MDAWHNLLEYLSCSDYMTRLTIPKYSLFYSRLFRLGRFVAGCLLLVIFTLLLSDLKTYLYFTCLSSTYKAIEK